MLKYEQDIIISLFYMWSLATSEFDNNNIFSEHTFYTNISCVDTCKHYGKQK